MQHVIITYNNTSSSSIELPHAQGRQLVYQSLKDGKAEQAKQRINQLFRSYYNEFNYINNGEVEFNTITNRFELPLGGIGLDSAQTAKSIYNWEVYQIDLLAKDLAPTSPDDERAISDYLKSSLSKSDLFGIAPRLEKIFNEILNNNMESNEEVFAKLQIEYASKNREHLTRLQASHQLAVSHYEDYASLRLSEQKRDLLVNEVKEMKLFSDQAKKNKANMLKLLQEVPCNHELPSTLLNKYELGNLSIRNLPSDAHQIIAFFTNLKEIDERRSGTQAQILYQEILTKGRQITELSTGLQLAIPSSPNDLAIQATQLPEPALLAAPRQQSSGFINSVVRILSFWK